MARRATISGFRVWLAPSPCYGGAGTQRPLGGGAVSDTCFVEVSRVVGHFPGLGIANRTGWRPSLHGLLPQLAVLQDVLHDIGLSIMVNQRKPTDYQEVERDFTYGSGDAQPLAKHTDSDVWLFETESDASAALAWLGKQGMKVPDDKRIVCLEDNKACFGQGITHCGYDWQTIGYLMAHAVIGDMPVSRTGRGFLRMEGVVVERGTT